MKSYISGIGGYGTYYLAKYFLALGYEVYGSDLKSSDRAKELEAKGAVIHVGEPDEGYLSEIKQISDFDIYVYSAALRGDHPERVLFEELCNSTSCEQFDVGEYTKKLLEGYFAGTLSDAEVKAIKEAELAPLAEIDWSARKYIGVTGTDGKTTTTTMIYHLLQKLGKKVAMINTVGMFVNGEVHDTGLHTTTPTSQELYKLLTSEALDGIEVVILEVTSHGLAMGRLAGAKLDVGVVTNVTGDHLDYHKTWENYLNAKALLLTEHLKEGGVAILNPDDKKSFEVLSEIVRKSGVKYLNPKQIVAREKIALPVDIDTDYNEMNALQSLSAVSFLFPEVKDNEAFLTDGLSDFESVSGRMQVMQREPFMVIVDFAHTANALEKVLTFLRKRVPKDAGLRVVFGCAGMRDKTKREKMGESAITYADVVYLCPEDPRLESMQEINSAVFKGVGLDYEDIPGHKNDFFETESSSGKTIKVFQEFSVNARRDAIEAAINDSQEGDIVVICGKGHEKSMCFGTEEFPWNDIEFVEKYLSKK